MNGPFSIGSNYLARRRRFDAGSRRAAADRLVPREPLEQLRAEVVGERAVEQLLALVADARGERLVHVHDMAQRVGHRHQVRDGIERVFQLPARPHDVVHQLHVLDGARELPAQLVGPIQQVELAARFDPDALEDDGPRARGGSRAAGRSAAP
jgi:hypothetical protein